MIRATFKFENDQYGDDPAGGVSQSEMVVDSPTYADFLVHVINWLENCRPPFKKP